MDEGVLNAVIFLDLTKAFDTVKRVNHLILKEELRLYGVDNIELKSFKSYLIGRQQRVCSISLSRSPAAV